MTTDIFNHLWQSTVFAGVVALLSLALRRNRARLRYGIWFVASVKFLVPFAALAAAGSLLEWRQAPAPIASVVTSPAVRAFQAPFAELSLDSIAVVAATPRLDWIASTLFAMWMCGFAVIVVRRVKQWRRIRATVRASAPWDATTDVHSAIRIRTAPTVLEPGVVGLWKPVILLPKGIDTYLTTRQLAAVLAHEVCHARRRDNLTAAVHMLVEALFWFHPMVWWIGSRLIAEREQACDEHVVAETAEPIAYAEGIVTICRRYVETPLMSVSGVGGADIKARIDSILANRIGVRLTLAKRIVLTTASVVALAVPLVTGAIDAAALGAGQLPGVTPAGPPVDPETRFEVASIKPFDPSGGDDADLDDAWPLRRRGIAVAARGCPGIGGSSGPHHRPAGLGQYRALHHCRQGPRRCSPGVRPRSRQRAGGHAGEPAEGSLQAGNAPRNARTARLQPGLRPKRQAFRTGIQGDLGGVPGDDQCAPRGGTTRRPRAGGASGSQRLPIQSRHRSRHRQFQRRTDGHDRQVILAQSVGRPVIDKTGLTSVYDFTLKWTPQPGSGGLTPFGLPLGGPPDAVPPADPDAPNLFTAVQEQLGLKLESARGPVEVVVIDRLEKPTPD